MANNGNVGNIDPKWSTMFPPQWMGEDILKGDLVGIREGADGIRKVFKAFAGVTGGGNTQLAALGVAMKDMFAGTYDGFWLFTPYNGIDVTTGGGLLLNLVNGEPVYLSDTVPGLAQRTAPVGVGKLRQVVGTGFYEKKRDPRAGDLAGGILFHVIPHLYTTL